MNLRPFMNLLSFIVKLYVYKSKIMTYNEGASYDDLPSYASYVYAY